MGWTFYHKRPGVSAVESIRGELGEEWCNQNIVAMTATREAVFIVVKRTDPDSKVYVLDDAEGTTRELGVIKIRNVPRARDGYNFGYKDLTETMGPYGCEAPLSILAQCSKLQDRPLEDGDTSGLASAREYRARCKAKAEAKALKRSLKPGDVVTLAKPQNFAGIPLDTFTVERARVRGRSARVSTVFRAANGMLCAVRADDLAGAVVTKRAE